MSAVAGARQIAQALRHVGARCMFGLPGTQNVALFEALRTSELRLVVATNELSAAMMAHGYYRASGRPGVLLTIPGPGFTWALTGVAEATLDSVAILHITSAPARGPGRRFQLQAIDQAAMAAPVTRRIVNIESAGEVAAKIAEAWHECSAGEPGPVLVQVSREVWKQDSADPVDGSTSTSAIPPSPPDVAAIAQVLKQARRRVLLLGQGCNDAADEVARLAEHLSAAVVTTTSGRGVVPEDHPLSLGYALAANDAEALNALIEASDVVLAIGCKFSHNGARGFRMDIPEQKLIHVDASREVLGANYPARIAVRAEARAFSSALLAELGPSPIDGFDADELAGWRARCENESSRSRSEPRVLGGTPAAFFAALRAAMPRESCLVTDSGRHQELARRYFPVLCPRGLIVPTNLQSMGFGIGAAIGARIAGANRPVVALIGDGGLAMSGLELLTAVRERIDLTVIVFVDGAYAAIRDQQITRYGHASGTLLPQLDCAALAAAVGAAHMRLDRDPENVLRDVVSGTGVTLVEVPVGDSLPMRWSQAKGLVKNMLRRGS